MKVNSINNYGYQITNNCGKKYTTRPVFKQHQPERAISTAVIETLVESANNKKNNNSLMGKLNFFRDVLFSAETTRKAQLLKEALESYDSTQNILYKA